MGGVADVVGGFFGGAIDAVGGIVNSAVETVGHAIESVGREVGKIGQAAVNDPIGTIAKVAAIATQQYWALPLISAADVVAHGGNIEQAALAAGVSVAASWAGGAIAAEIASPAADSAAGMITQDAAEMAKSGLGADQIQQVLQQSYPEVSNEILNSISTASAAGISATTLASAYAGAFGSALNGTLDMTAQQIAAVPLGNAAANFAKTLVQTNGDIGKALLAGTGAGVGTAFGNLVSSEMSGAGVNGSIAQVTGKITAAATSGIIQGQDPSKALGTALVNNIISTSYAQAGGALREAWAQSGVNELFSKAGTSVVNDLNKTAADQKAASEKAASLESQSNGIASKYDGLVKTSSDYYNSTVVPAENEAKSLQTTANSFYDTYKPIRDQFSGYVSQYDSAKAAYDAVNVPAQQTDGDGNVTNQSDIDAANQQRSDLAKQMNDFADKANALVPSLNDATSKYNTAATAYQTSADKLNTIASTYTGYSNQLTQLKTDYTNTGIQFKDTVATANGLTDKFNTTADQLQKQIDQIITDKKTADEQLSGVSDAAKLAYQNSFSTGNMQPLDAAKIGQQVSQLSDTAQNAFNQSFGENPDVNASLKMATDVNALSDTQQQSFARSVDTGLNTADALTYAPKLDNVSDISKTAFYDAFKEDQPPAEALNVATQVNALSDTNQTLYAKVKDSTGLSTLDAFSSTNNISNFATKAQDAFINGVNDTLTKEQAFKTANVVNDGVSASELPTQLKESYLNFIDKGGMSADQALASAKSLTTLSTAAVDAFNENYKKTNDQTAALNVATQVSSMSLPQQQTFLQSTNTGLTQDQALVAAKNITGMDSAVQAAYINAIKNGADVNLATNAAAIAGFFQAQSTPVTDKSVVLSTDGTNAIIKNLGTGVVTEVPLMSGAGVGTILGKALDVIVPSAQAGELPKNPQPDNPNVVQEVYQKNPMGGWSTVIPDGKGGYTTIAQQAIPGNFTPKEGEGTGKWYNNAPADGQGFPQEVTPAAPLPDPNAVNTQNPIVDATASADGKTATYKDSLGGTQTVELATGKVLSETPPTSNPITDLAGQISKYYDPNAITPQDFSGSIFTGKTATSTTGTSGTGTGTTPTGGTGAGTTGTGTTGGATSGTGTGAGTTDGTGTGTGTTAGTGTGAGTGDGTGSGTGTGGTGTGAGTGAGGTGSGSGTGTAIKTGAGLLTGWGTGSTTDTTGGIKNLAPGLTQNMDYSLSGLPNIQENLNPINTGVPQFATGGSTTSQYDPYATGTSGISQSLTPGLTKAQLNYILAGMPGANVTVGHADGGSIEGHNPTFFSEGGLGSIENRHVQGEGDGTSDSIEAMLADGEFVIPADVVSDLGNGSNEAGASVLDQFLKTIREHKQSNGVKLPPDSKGPLAYLTDAKRKAKV
jgi:hypothetical protein